MVSTGIFLFCLGLHFDLSPRIILLIDKLQDNCDKRGNGSASELNYIEERRPTNRGSEQVGEIKEMDNLRTDARGREKVDFAQVVKVAKS